MRRCRSAATRLQKRRFRRLCDMPVDPRVSCYTCGDGRCVWLWPLRPLRISLCATHRKKTALAGEEAGEGADRWCRLAPLRSRAYPAPLLTRVGAARRRACPATAFASSVVCVTVGPVPSDADSLQIGLSPPRRCVRSECQFVRRRARRGDPRRATCSSRISGHTTPPCAHTTQHRRRRRVTGARLTALRANPSH